MTESANNNDGKATRSYLELPTPNDEPEEQSLNEATDEAQPKLPSLMHAPFSTAEQFINIPELRLMLYSCMAGPKTDKSATLLVSSLHLRLLMLRLKLS